MIKNLFLLSIFCFLAINTQAQNKKLLDSLNTVYNTAKHDTTKIMALVAIAYEYLNSKPDTCIALATQALGKSEKINFEMGKGWAMNRIGAGNWVKSNYPEALGFSQKALSVFEKIQDKKGMGNTSNGIGLIYDTQGNYPLALEYYQKSLKIAEEIGDKQGISNSLNNIGSNYSEQGNYPLALEYYQKTLKISEEMGNENDISLSLSNIGSIYSEQGNYPLALEYLQKSLKIQEEIGEINIAYALIVMAEVYQKQKDYDKSIEYARKSLKIAQETKALSDVGDASKTLFNSYKLKGDYAKALEYHELYTLTNDSIFNMDKSKAIANLEAKAEIEKQQVEIEKKQVEIEKNQVEILKEKEAKEFQQYINYLVIAGLLAVLVFAYFIFKLRQKEKKAKEEVLQQKEEIQQINEELHTTLETVKLQKTEIEGKNERINDSIRYAQRIQKALLPFEEKFAQHLGKENFFILHKPKDVVSGDFYFFQEVDNKLIIMAVDCTGHGVPGAFMSMIGINLLEEIIVFQRNTNPAEILTLLHKKIRFVLKQKETKNVDGMDLSMVVIDKEQKIMEFAGAKNAMIYIQNKELYTLKADKMPIGGEQKEEERIFTKQSVDISQPTTIYLFTDGYQDQFGGKKKKKFMISQMRELFLGFQNIQMSEQQNILNQTIEDWKIQGQEKQIDDILVLGVKI
jgi:tetratricopeptide (TPR) repeat protein